MSNPEPLLRVLRARPTITAGEACGALGVCRATLMRMVQAAGPEVLTVGHACRTRYAARRPLPGCEQPLPVFQIDEQGGYEQVANLNLAYPHGSVVAWTGDCPWPLAEEEQLQALSRLGVDPIGNHIIGSAALELYLNEQKNPREPLQEAHVPPGYAEFADKAVARDISNSLVPGKFRKFTALREHDGTSARVLVKFSALDDSPSSVRWADLLVRASCMPHLVRGHGYQGGGDACRPG